MTPKMERAILTEAYKSLLRLPQGESRARIQPALASLRDEIARIDGESAEAVQNKFEAIAHKMIWDDHG